MRAAVFNPGLNKMSVPSIPSRFLTPIIDSSAVEHGTTDSQGDLCKMSRLINDPSKVGPGTYENLPPAKGSPHGIINWNLTRSSRSPHAGPTSHTQATVGPGSYDTIKNYDKKPRTMTLARSGISKTAGNRFSTGPISNQFGDDEENETYVSPGPGSYNMDSLGRKPQY
jgi:hypothetical protein